jgi:hypothetical protein
MSSKSIYRICNSNIIVHLHFIVPWPLPIPDPAGSRSILHYGCWGRKLIGNTIHLDMRGWPICCWFKGNYASAWWKHYSSSIVLDSLRTAHIRIVRTVVSFVSLCPSQIPARKSSLTNCWTFISIETCTCLMDWPTMVAVPAAPGIYNAALCTRFQLVLSYFPSSKWRIYKGLSLLRRRRRRSIVAEIFAGKCTMR